MKRMLILVVMFLLSSVAVCQNNAVSIFINGYSPGDTIAVGNFVSIDSLSTSNKGFAIVGFKLNIMDSGFLKEFKSDSYRLTDEMKNTIMGLKDKNMRATKIFFEDIKVKTPDGKVRVIGGLLHVVKIK